MAKETKLASFDRHSRRRKSISKCRFSRLRSRALTSALSFSKLFEFQLVCLALGAALLIRRLSLSWAQA